MSTSAVAATYVRSAESEDIGGTDFGKRPILWTVVVISGVSVLGNLVLWVGAATGTVDHLVFWPPIFAIVVSVVGLVSFGGFYVAARRARVAIMASVVTTFIVMMVFSLSITALNESASAELARSLVGDFRTIVLTVVSFYFGTETVLTVTKILATRNVEEPVRHSLGRVDRDLPIIG